MDKPTHFVYAVEEFAKSNAPLEPTAFKIGVGYDRLDDKGIDLVLEALPLTRRISVRWREPQSLAEEREQLLYRTMKRLGKRESRHLDDPQP